MLGDPLFPSLEVVDTPRPHGGRASSASSPTAHGEIDRDAQAKAFARSMRKKMIGAVLIAVISTGATAMSCAGQGIAYKQMRAIEAIAQKCGK